jgi:two-component system, OmpR family, sensor histidine kinase VicK
LSDLPDNHNEKTEVIYSSQNIISKGLEFLSEAKEKFDNCVDHAGPSALVETKAMWEGVAKLSKSGIKVRFITDINKANITYCKQIIEIAELRHLEGVKGNFAILDRTHYGAVATVQEKTPLSIWIHSTIKSFIEQQQYFFDMLWNKAIPAEQKIKEIEEGIEPEAIETIRNPIEIQKIGHSLIKSAKKEILIIFSTANAFYRQDKAGTVDLLIQAAASSPNMKIRILTPVNELIRKETMQKLSNVKVLRQRQERQQEQRQEQEQIYDVNNVVGIRHIEPSMQTRVTVLIIDRKYCLVVELKDDSKATSFESIGLAVYSNSKPTVLSYASIFESLWMQSELYRQLREANEQLKANDIIQKEFINIAAHELRNPIQPILALTEVVKRKEKDTEQKELLDGIARNAKKLKRLAEDVLDITRIESNSLQLNKEEFDLRDLIVHVVQDYKNQILANHNKIKLEYYDYQQNEKEEEEEEDDHITKDIAKMHMTVRADRYRINQVISNLVSNSINFTEKGGTISVEIMRTGNGKNCNKCDDDNNNNNNAVTVRVKDTGTGIDAEIMPRLFSKFATKSDTGTGIGLGLYISKSIIESHGGKIWAENNSDGKGATFSFNLPVANKQIDDDTRIKH